MASSIELSDEVVKSLDDRALVDGVAREEVVRRALERYLTLRVSSYEVGGKRESWPELEKVLGAWRNPDRDGTGATEYPRNDDALLRLKAAREAGAPWPELDTVFGTWKDRDYDTVEYIRRIREGDPE